MNSGPSGPLFFFALLSLLLSLPLSRPLPRTLPLTLPLATGPAVRRNR